MATRPCCDHHQPPGQTLHGALVDISEIFNKSKEDGANNDASGELKKLDSFGKWMDKEIGGDCDDSLMASASGNYWNTLDTQNDNKEIGLILKMKQRFQS